MKSPMLGKKSPWRRISPRLRSAYSSLATPESRELTRFLAIRTNHPDPCQRLLRHRADIGELLLNSLEALVNHPAEVPRGHRDQRQRDQGHQCETGIDGRHHRDGDDEGEGGARGVENRRADHHANRAQIVGRARHQIAGPIRVKERQRQALEVRVEGVADVVLDRTGRADQHAGGVPNRVRPPTTAIPSKSEAYWMSFASVTPADRSSIALFRTQGPPRVMMLVSTTQDSPSANRPR